MVNNMIDSLITYVAKLISKLANPSTILKYALLFLIISFALSFLLGQWLIIFALVVNNTIWMVTEFLYSKAMEDEEGD